MWAKARISLETKKNGGGQSIKEVKIFESTGLRDCQIHGRLSKVGADKRRKKKRCGRKEKVAQM